MRLAEAVDQATGLRRLFAGGPGFRALALLGPDPRRSAHACAELALGLARQGQQVLVLDEARAPYNVGGMWGVLPRHTLAHLPRVSMAEAALQPHPGVRLLAAPEGAQALAGLDEQAVLGLADDLGSAPDWMLINAAGSPRARADLATTTAWRVLVLPGDKAWLADTYGLLKAAHAAGGGGDWLVLVEGAEAEVAQRLHASLQDTAQRFLGVTPRYLGHLAQGAHDGAASAAALTEAVQGGAAADEISFAQFWQRLWLFSRMAEAVPRGLGATGGRPRQREGHGSRRPR